MNERAILFSAPMVRANLEGRKSMTRRTMKDQPERQPVPQNDDKLWWQEDIACSDGVVKTNYYRCPYGGIGDVLWVRETWTWEGDTSYKDLLPIGSFWYKADFEKNEGPAKWKSSIFMPREACRLKLEIVNIKIERLNNISEEDAVAEGVERAGTGWKCYRKISSGRHRGEDHPYNVVSNRSPVFSYMELWENINGEGSWSKNPWVWVIEYKKL